MCIPIARQQLGKGIPVTRARNSRTSIARQRHGTHALATTEEVVFSVWSVPHFLTCDTCFL
jgi:hypothetical protein